MKNKGFANILIIILSLLVIGGGVYLYTGSNEVEELVPADVVQEESNDNSFEVTEEENENIIEQDIKEETLVDIVQEEKEVGSLEVNLKTEPTEPKEPMNDEIVKYVAKYREMTSIIGKQDVVLFVTHLKENADHLLSRGLVSEQKYNEFIDKVDSTSEEEIEAGLSFMSAFGFGSYDKSLPDDKFLNEDEIVTLYKDGNNVSINVEVKESEKSKHSQSFNFIVDPKDGTVFEALDF